MQFVCRSRRDWPEKKKPHKKKTCYVPSTNASLYEICINTVKCPDVIMKKTEQKDPCKELFKHGSSARSINRIHENETQAREQSPKQPVLLEHNKTGAQLQMSRALKGTGIRTE